MYTFKDLLKSINVLELDIDVTIDTEGTFAVVAPVVLTEKALKKYDAVLKLPINKTTVYAKTKAQEKLLPLAYQLIRAKGGYCTQQEFTELFENGKQIS